MMMGSLRDGGTNHSPNGRNLPMTTSTPTIIELGQMTLTISLRDASDFSYWNQFDFADEFSPSENFEEMDPDDLASLIHSLQSEGRLIIEENGESYVGRGQTVFHYTFSYSC
jgi:hypothetical protein